MKKMILIITFVMTGVMMNAQEKDAYTVDAEKLIELSSKQALMPTVEQFAGMVPAEKKEAFLKDVEGTFPDFFSAMAKIYKDEFTHEEIKELLAFYNSPIGQKMASKQGTMMQKGMVAGQAWGMKIQGLLGKYK